ncbi:MAG: 30S ribosomal protein S4 [candidate division WWE3 bacterium GW2011_GWB1_47_11]|nr:MAG: 30S ribosomal protein S4 [candidate division WWE3 bacterium GW2011_GWA2_46_9]KKU50866.1 MAG: 30S ribosomal protein S4 [candidate division WWE3 bacterium GW2011_GWC1_47_10]KKU58142.1 MAG: 30S ribosomal protein S4 [candidate division WWE3 bacterium GW2011_GWB1_47_11]
MKLFLKGARCEGEKCAVSKRQQVPGQHGNSRRRPSQYGLQLREKQKVKRIYGVLEAQFRKYVDKAMVQKGVTGESLMHRLESRLDNMVYRGGFAASRAQARQLIRSGFFTLDGKAVTIPSIQVKVGSIVKPVDFGRIQPREGFLLAEWLEANVKEKSITLNRLPSLDDLPEDVNVQLIVEYYSR